MKVDKWFNEQALWLKIVLLLLPIVGWVVEVLVRLSVALRHKDVMHWVVLGVFVVFGGFWVLAIIDLVYLIVKKHLIFTEE